MPPTPARKAELVWASPSAGPSFSSTEAASGRNKTKSGALLSASSCPTVPLSRFLPEKRQFRAIHNRLSGKIMSRRILIIDDEEDIREVAALSLETVAGWDVIVAGSGAAGILKARENHPDAI